MNIVPNTFSRTRTAFTNSVTTCQERLERDVPAPLQNRTRKKGNYEFYVKYVTLILAGENHGEINSTRCKTANQINQIRGRDFLRNLIGNQPGE